MDHHDDHPHAPEFRFREDRHTRVFVCKHVWNEGSPILRVAHDEEGDWQFLCGEDHSGDGAEDEPVLVCLEHVVTRDASLNALADMCPNHRADRSAAADEWSVHDETEDQIHEAIAEHGWWVAMVDADDEGPAFAYSVGIYKTLKKPELVLFGLSVNTMAAIINDYGRMIREGRVFPEDAPVTGLVGDDVNVVLRRVRSKDAYREYLGYAGWYYGGDDFPVLQLVWPDKENRFPWDPDVATAVVRVQPLLSS